LITKTANEYERWDSRMVLMTVDGFVCQGMDESLARELEVDESLARKLEKIADR
jgi:hypothetical protein